MEHFLHDVIHMQNQVYYLADAASGKVQEFNLHVFHCMEKFLQCNNGLCAAPSVCSSVCETATHERLVLFIV